jgi:HEAT repeat protein
MRFDQRLRGGSPRSLGATAEVVTEVLADPDRLAELFECVLDDDEVVRMRAGDALEKVTRQRPDWLVPYLDRLLTEIAAIQQPSVRWHLAQILGEVPLDAGQRRRAVRLLEDTLAEATDWIVLTCTMTALTTVALDGADPDGVRDRLAAALRRRVRDPRPAVAKRAARELTRLERHSRLV